MNIAVCGIIGATNGLCPSYTSTISFERSHAQIQSCRIRLGHDCQNPTVLVDAERDSLDLRQGKQSCETSASVRRCLRILSCKTGKLTFNFRLRDSDKIARALGQSNRPMLDAGPCVTTLRLAWMLSIKAGAASGSTTIMLGFMPHTESQTERLLSQSGRHSTHTSRFS